MRVFWGARRKARERKSPQAALWQTKISGEALGVARDVKRDPYRNASSRILRRAAPGGPWRPGGGGLWGAVESRRCVLRPWGSQVLHASLGHPGDRVKLILKQCGALIYI